MIPAADAHACVYINLAMNGCSSFVSGNEALDKGQHVQHMQSVHVPLRQGFSILYLAI